MKKKKLIVCLLSLVMVLSLCLSLFAGCDKNKDNGQTKEPTVAEVLQTALENTAKGKYLNNMEISANLSVETTYGTSTNKYNVNFVADLDFDTSKTTKNNAFSLEITDATDNSKLVTAYYYEESTDVYLSFKSGDSMKKFKIKGVNIKDVLVKNHATIGDEAAESINDDVISSVSGVFDIFPIIGQFGDFSMSKDKKVVTLSLDLGELLSQPPSEDEDNPSFIDILAGLGGDEGQGGINETLTAIGLDMQLTDLATILPALKVAVNVNLEGTGDNVKITGFGVDLDCKKHEIKVMKTAEGDEEQEALLDIVIAKDFSAKLGLDLAFKSVETDLKYPDNYDDYIEIGALNLTAGGSFTIDKDIVQSIGGVLNINIPAGAYDLELALNADPSWAVNYDFTANQNNIMKIVTDVLNNAVNYLKLDIKYQEAGKGSLIMVEIWKEGTQIKASAKLGALTGNDTTITGLPLKNLLDIVQGIIDGLTPAPKPEESGDVSGDASGDVSGDVSGDASGDASGDKINFAEIAKYVKALQLVAKDGQISASFKETAVGKLDGKDIVLGGKVTVNSTGVTIDATLAGLLSEKLTVQIKLSSFTFGDAPTKPAK